MTSSALLWNPALGPWKASPSFRLKHFWKPYGLGNTDRKRRKSIPGREVPSSGRQSIDSELIGRDRRVARKNNVFNATHSRIKRRQAGALHRRAQ
jgi:hypothetical protein